MSPGDDVASLGSSVPAARAGPTSEGYCSAVGTPPPERHRAADLLRLVTSGLGDDPLEAIAPDRLCIVALDGSADEARLGEAAAALPTILVGVGAPSVVFTPPPGLDIVLTEEPDPPRPWVACAEGVDTTLRNLASRVAHAPAASLTLIQTLRTTELLPVAPGLVTESLAYGLLQSGPEHAAWLAARAPRPIPVGEEPPVLLVRVDGALRITLNRPRRHNSYTAEMRDGLVEGLRLALGDPTIERVELRGAGASFSSGGDLDEFGSRESPVAAHLVRSTRSAAAAAAGLTERLVAYLHGACVGAGIEIPAFAGHVSATSDTMIRLPEIEFGLIPGAGGTVSLPRRIGRARAAYLALSGTVLGAEEALAWGLVDAIDDDPHGGSTSWAPEGAVP
jgi:enoyl-CoA hydratase/carnithine racemase